MALDRPNILLVTTDQQRTDSLSCYGSTFTDTPHLDRLAQQGVRFDRAYCTNPVCTPSRASIFTGLYPSRHGAWNVGVNVPEQPLLSHRLAEVGYTTGYVGKAHLQAFFGTPAQSAESAGANARYPDWYGPYYGFETAELAIMHGHAAWRCVWTAVVGGRPPGRHADCEDLQDRGECRDPHLQAAPGRPDGPAAQRE